MVFLEFLRGRKTYLVAAALIVLAGLHAQGYLNDSTYTTLQAMLTGAGFAALRAGVTKGSS